MFFYLLTDSLKKKKNKINVGNDGRRRLAVVPARQKKKNVISWRCERAPASPAAGLNLEKLSSRHLKVFTADKVLSWAVSKNLKKKKKTQEKLVFFTSPTYEEGGGAQEHFQTADVSVKIAAASRIGNLLMLRLRFNMHGSPDIHGTN